MKLECWMIGDTAFPYLKEGMQLYEKRIKGFLPFQTRILQGPKQSKSLSEEQQKEEEGKAILKALDSQDTLVLFDERGKSFDSPSWAAWMDKQFQHSGRGRLVLLIGGPYGFSEALYQRAEQKISLSKMTFSHQMIRLFVLEQIYRGLSILRNLPYHHA